MNSIAIIGAGVSGLSAAIQLKQNKIPFVIYEGSDRIGGRIKTDEVDGFLLDHGFQVLQTAYPMARDILDYAKLDLASFYSGAKVFHNGSWKHVGDPSRDPLSSFSTLRSGISTFTDNLKILKLKTQLSALSVNDIFSGEESSTKDYLKKYGFSDKIIERFFTPFLAGIFLEQKLSTSSKMFKFVFKIFTEGKAALPKGGMQAIPKQMVKSIGEKHIHLDHSVKEIKKGEIIFSNGEFKKHSKVINATNWSTVVNTEAASLATNSVINLYFKSSEPIDDIGILYLNGSSTGIINNIAFPDAVQSSYAPDGQHLISVSVLDAAGLDETELIKTVQTELKTYFGPRALGWEFLKLFTIKKALPVKNEIDIPVKLKHEFNGCTVVDAGDLYYYGSLNAALLSGRRAAKAIID